MNLSSATLQFSAIFRTQVGSRLRCARAAIGKTQDELAAHLGIARQTLGSYEKGESEPLASILKKMCNDFSIDPAWLLLGDDTRPMFAICGAPPKQRAA